LVFLYSKRKTELMLVEVEKALEALLLFSFNREETSTVDG